MSRTNIIWVVFAFAISTSKYVDLLNHQIAKSQMNVHPIWWQIYKKKFTYTSTSCCQKHNGAQHTTINIKRNKVQENSDLLERKHLVK
jgi:hypothetical protein